LGSVGDSPTILGGEDFKRGVRPAQMTHGHPSAAAEPVTASVGNWQPRKQLDSVRRMGVLEVCAIADRGEGYTGPLFCTPRGRRPGGVSARWRKSIEGEVEEGERAR
jgi:hypothetical protein